MSADRRTIRSIDRMLPRSLSESNSFRRRDCRSCSKKCRDTDRHPDPGRRLRSTGRSKPTRGGCAGGYAGRCTASCGSRCSCAGGRT